MCRKVCVQVYRVIESESLLTLPRQDEQTMALQNGPCLRKAGPFGLIEK